MQQKNVKNQVESFTSNKFKSIKKHFFFLLIIPSPINAATNLPIFPPPTVLPNNDAKSDDDEKKNPPMKENIILWRRQTDYNFDHYDDCANANSGPLFPPTLMTNI